MKDAKINKQKKQLKSQLMNHQVHLFEHLSNISKIHKLRRKTFKNANSDCLH